MSSFHVIAQTHQPPRPACCRCCWCCGRVVAQADPAIELKEVQATLQASADRIAELEARLAKAQEQVEDACRSARLRQRRLTAGARVLRAASHPDGRPRRCRAGCIERRLQDRLLTAAERHAVLKNRNQALANALIELSQATLDYAKAAAPCTARRRRQLDAKLAPGREGLASTQTEAAPAHETDSAGARASSA